MKKQWQETDNNNNNNNNLAANETLILLAHQGVIVSSTTLSCYSAALDQGAPGLTRFSLFTAAGRKQLPNGHSAGVKWETAGVLRPCTPSK